MDEEKQRLVNEIKEVIQDCNVNFLYGAGTSSPYLKLLGNVENLLTQESSSDLSDEQSKIIRTSIYKYFYDECIERNLDVLEGEAKSIAYLETYKEFLKAINYILLKRKSTILSKQANLFTTNVDIFTEKALEESGLEYNDGFSGRFNPKYSLSNFKKSQFKKSLHYDITSEMPIFNLIKLHGSLTWQLAKNQSIEFTSDLSKLLELKKISFPRNSLVTVDDDSTIEGLIEQSGNIKLDKSVEEFMEIYDQLSIVNPTKEKFKHTLLNQTYYELFRIYANELEKENTVLFVAGFSFADEHIREVTIRAANSNPTLMLYIFAFSTNSRLRFEALFEGINIKNKNIKIISPQQKHEKGKPSKDLYNYDLKTINLTIFEQLLPNEIAKHEEDIEDTGTLEK